MAKYTGILPPINLADAGYSNSTWLKGTWRRLFVSCAVLSALTAANGYSLRTRPSIFVSRDTYYEAAQDGSVNTTFYAELSCNYTGIGAGSCGETDVKWLVLTDYEEVIVDGKMLANNSGPPASVVVPTRGCVQHVRFAIEPGRASSYLYACRVTDTGGRDYDSLTVPLNDYIELNAAEVSKSVPIGSNVEIVCPSANDKPPGCADAEWKIPEAAQKQKNVKTRSNGSLSIQSFTSSNAGVYECWLKGNPYFSVRAANTKSIVNILPFDRPTLLENCTASLSSDKCNIAVTCLVPKGATSPVHTVKVICEDGYEKEEFVNPEQDFIAVGVENAAGERRCRIYSEDVVGASSNYSNAIVIPALPHRCIVSDTELSTSGKLIIEQQPADTIGRDPHDYKHIKMIASVASPGLVVAVIIIAVLVVRQVSSSNSDGTSPEQHGRIDDGPRYDAAEQNHHIMLEMMDGLADDDSDSEATGQESVSESSV